MNVVCYDWICRGFILKLAAAPYDSGRYNELLYQKKEIYCCIERF